MEEVTFSVRPEGHVRYGQAVNQVVHHGLAWPLTDSILGYVQDAKDESRSTRSMRSFREFPTTVMPKSNSSLA